MLYQALPWLPEGKSLDAAQAEVFEILQKKVGREVVLPLFPHDDVTTWQFLRYYPGGEADVDKIRPAKDLSPQKRLQLYTLVSEDLLVARQLLQNPRPEQQRRGLQVADSVTGKIAVLLDDKPLNLRVNEAFVLPYLSVAHTEHTLGLSRTQLLKAACVAYLVSKETSKYRDALRAFITVAGQAGSAGEVDWARVKLAGVLAQSGDYAEAIVQLKAVPDASSLSLARDRMLPQLQAKQNEQRKNAKLKTEVNTN